MPNIISGGPQIIQNWCAWRRGESVTGVYEYPLFTDAWITGGHLNLGPYWIYNTIAHASTMGSAELAPALVLRLGQYLPKNELPQMVKTEVGSYHGGSLPDEFAALVSLRLGIRLKAGAITRQFSSDDTDPKGTPVAYFGFGEPLLVKNHRRPVLPAASGAHGLGALETLSGLPDVAALDAVALVRAARLYQEALWIAESTPAMSWLLMVSAVECAAHRWDQSTATRVERLRASKPKLVAALEKRCPDLIEVVADQIADSTGATNKFLKFMLSFQPPPPAARPPEGFQTCWTRPQMKKALAKIYDYRCQALHAGIPFPAPMCEPPSTLQSDWPATGEKPFGLASAMQGGVWLEKDLPMHLHIFEYLARGALVGWWDSIVNRSPGEDLATQEMGPGS